MDATTDCDTPENTTVAAGPGEPRRPGTVTWEDPEPLARHLSNRAFTGGLLVTLWLVGWGLLPATVALAATIVWGTVVFVGYERPLVRRLYRTGGWLLLTWMFVVGALVLTWQLPLDTAMHQVPGVIATGGLPAAVGVATALLRAKSLVAVLREPDLGLFGSTDDVETFTGTTHVRALVISATGATGIALDEQLPANRTLPEKHKVSVDADGVHLTDSDGDRRLRGLQPVRLVGLRRRTLAKWAAGPAGAVVHLHGDAGRVLTILNGPELQAMAAALGRDLIVEAGSSVSSSH